MTQFILSGSGHRIHTGKITKKNYDRLEKDSESSDDGSVDIWDYIDMNIAYGVAPEYFQVLIDNNKIIKIKILSWLNMKEVNGQN